MVTDTVPRHTHTQHPCTNLPQRSARPASSRCSRSRSRSSRSRSRCLPHAPRRTPCRSARRARRRPADKSPRPWTSRHPAPSRSPTTPARPHCGTRSATVTSTAASRSAPTGGSLLIATGASPMVAQMLTQIGNGIAQHAGVPLRHRGSGPADRRRSARRRAGRIRAADHPGRTAACDRRWCSRSSARSGPDSRRWWCSPASRA